MTIIFTKTNCKKNRKLQLKKITLTFYSYFQITNWVVQNPLQTKKKKKIKERKYSFKMFN